MSVSFLEPVVLSIFAKRILFSVRNAQHINSREERRSLYLKNVSLVQSTFGIRRQPSRINSSISSVSYPSSLLILAPLITASGFMPSSSPSSVSTPSVLTAIPLLTTASGFVSISSVSYPSSLLILAVLVTVSSFISSSPSVSTSSVFTPLVTADAANGFISFSSSVFSCSCLIPIPLVTVDGLALSVLLLSVIAIAEYSFAFLFLDADADIFSDAAAAAFRGSYSSVPPILCNVILLTFTLSLYPATFHRIFTSPICDDKNCCGSSLQSSITIASCSFLPCLTVMGYPHTRPTFTLTNIP